MKLTIEKKILAGFILCCLILLTVAIISFQNSEKYVDTNLWVNHTHEVLYEFEEVLISAVDGQAGARGYIITGDETYIEPFKTATDNLAIHLNKAKELTKDNPAQQHNIQMLDKITKEHFDYLATCISLRKTEGFEKVQKLISDGDGKRILDELRNTISLSKEVEQNLLVKRKKSSEDDANSFNVVFITLLAVITFVLIIVYLIIIANIKALKKAETETANRNWNLAGSTELVKSMQGNKILSELSQAIINHLAVYLNAQVGAFYITEKDGISLRLVSAYAIDRDKKEFPLLRYGQGLAGQSAANKKTIQLTDIPPDYFKINTSFGNTLPKEVIAIPVIFEGTVTSVIELGTVHTFTDLHKQYLNIVVDSIAIAITSAQVREKSQELLEETQRQAEELQSQQEELKQSNEELFIKTELLERSGIELKSQQEELKRSNEELEEKATILGEQNDKLEIAKKEIESKANEVEITSKYKSEFLANMSHELRTPLNSILILSQLLSENKNNTLGNKEIEFARNIHSSGSDLLSLINEILDLSKVEAGKIQLDVGEVLVQNIISSMSSLFTEIGKNKAVEFTVELQKPLPATLFTDKQRVEQILKNLLSNAFKFTDPGGKVSLIVSTTQQIKSNGTKHVSDQIIFSVTDTGIGIPEDKQAVVFEAFQQADGSTKRKYGGTGLGLSISRKLAQVLGGEIQLKSEAGKGSTFALHLPVVFDSTMEIIPDHEIEVKTKNEDLSFIEKRSILGKENSEPVINDDRTHLQTTDQVILIIEDDEEFSNVLLEFVRQRNFKGIIARQGNTGISYARQYNPDAILLDMKLPVINGLAVLKQIKNDPNLRHIPIQIISAFDHKKEVLESGAFDYIVKPVSTIDLQRMFDRLEEFRKKDFKKLLIVEDNELQNKAIQELIGGNDVKCYAAYRGSEAFTKLKEENFDCVIIDLGLPDMSGFELMEKIKADNNLNRIPIIVYTGRDLKKEDIARLDKLASTVILKTADSKERLLDETMLLLHRVESKLPKEKQSIIRKLHGADEVLRNRKILLVDDDIRNIYSLTNALEEEGLICFTAENGKIALTMLKDNPSIELILMDVMMPEMDGYETTIEIRKSKEFAKLPIIALTAKAMKGDKEKCLAIGMSDYISKPVNIEQLLSLMRVCLYPY
ncbi:MAG TPA: response regulator [Cyclobacteriaceae bacterium]